MGAVQRGVRLQAYMSVNAYHHDDNCGDQRYSDNLHVGIDVSVVD